MADDDDRREAGTRFAWISIFFAAWIVGGLALASWALGQGLTRDFGFSAYHVPAYLGLLALAVFCVSIVVRAVRRDRPWRAAFPPGYGMLGAGALVLLAYPIVDVAWREGVGIAVINGSEIENWLAPSRLLIPVGVVLVAVGPLRVAARSGGSSGSRWAAVLSAGLVLAALGLVGRFQPAANPWLERPPEAVQGETEIWAMDADGAHQTRLIEADSTSSASVASWSPDEGRIVYTRWGVGSNGVPDADIWVARADGSGRHLLVGGAQDWQWFPSWSPDGAWIVYTQEPAGGPEMSVGPAGPGVGALLQGFGWGPAAEARPHASIWRVRADGTGSPMRLTDGLADDRAAVYSPDGTRLVFDSLRDGNTQIYVMNADGSQPIRLTHDDVEDWGASWSPDGRRIVFMSDYQIYAMNADGSGRTRLTHDEMFDREPTWSPDGSRIAFDASGGDNNVIWSIAVDGTDARNLSRSPGASAFLGGSNGAWGRDGRILFNRVADPQATSQPIARQDLGAAAMLLEAILVAIVALVVVRIGPPFGAFAVIMGMAAFLAASGSAQWRFVPAAVAGGLLVDVLIRFAPPRRRANVAAAASPAVFVLGAGVTVAATTGLVWSPTLLLGVASATAALGWGLAGVVGRPVEATDARTAA